MIVDGFNAALRYLVTTYARLFDPVGAFAGLIVASLLVGVAMLWVVGKTSDQRAIGRAKKLMQARLLEMRLYRDEPWMLFRSQAHLLLNNARYLGHMLRPALFLALPMVVLFGHFDAVYGRRPLHVGESALVTATADVPASDLQLAASAGFEVETVSVAIPESNSVVWRIRAVDEGASVLTLSTPQGTVAKHAVAGAATPYVSTTKTGSWWQRLLLSPGENGDVPAPVRSIEIDYPSSTIGVGAWQTHWLVWFLVASIACAYLLKGTFGIVL